MTRIRNLAFVLWMLGAWLISILDLYVNEHLRGRSLPIEVGLVADIVSIIIYVYVACLLYEGKHSE
jgi:hypothetical protein